jgi:hypothetical protein
MYFAAYLSAKTGLLPKESDEKASFATSSRESGPILSREFPGSF